MIQPDAMGRRAATFLPALVSLALCLGTAAGVQAQTASQITRDSYAPPANRPAQGGISLPASKGLAVPPGAEKVFVTLAGVSVQGGFAEMADATRQLARGITGRRVSAADLFTFSQKLEAAYVQAGYVLARVSLPAQTVEDGQKLKLVVTDGSVARIDDTALPARVRGRVSHVTAPLIGQRHLTRRELERRVLLAGDAPGLQLKSTLSPGQLPGTADLILDGRQAPVTGSVMLDNSLGAALGHVSAALGLNFNSLLGLGETGYIYLGGYPARHAGYLSGDPRNRQVVAGMTLPVGANGNWLGLEAVDSATHPDSDDVLVLKDHFRRLKLSYGHNWLRSRTANTSSEVSLNFSQEKQTLLLSGTGYDFAEDRLRVLRLAQSADGFTRGGGYLSGTATLSVGLNALGAREPTTSLPMTRDGAEPSFRKLAVTLNYEQQIWKGRLRGLVKMAAQTSFGHALPASEQFGIGGLNWLSAFDSGDMEGDSMAVIRGELASSDSVKGRHVNGVLTPYLFIGAGAVRLEKPSTLEEGFRRAVAYGGGLRMDLAHRGGSAAARLTLELSQGKASDDDHDNRISVKLETTF